MNQALVLGRQHHVHEHDGEQKRPAELDEGAFELPAPTGHGCGVGRRHPEVGGRLPKGRDTIREPEARSDTGS